MPFMYKQTDPQMATKAALAELQQAHRLVQDVDVKRTPVLATQDMYHPSAISRMAEQRGGMHPVSSTNERPRAHSSVGLPVPPLINNNAINLDPGARMTHMSPFDQGTAPQGETESVGRLSKRKGLSKGARGTREAGREQGPRLLQQHAQSTLTPAWMMINANIAGHTINDVEFYVEYERESAFANWSVLEIACPQLLKLVKPDDTLTLAADLSLGASDSSSKAPLPPRARTNEKRLEDHLGFLEPTYKPSEQAHKRHHSEAGQEHTLSWLRRASTAKWLPKKATMASPEPEPEREPEMFISAPIITNEEPTNPRLRRICLHGCSVQSMRALLFYLITSQVAFVDLFTKKLKEGASVTTAPSDPKPLIQRNELGLFESTTATTTFKPSLASMRHPPPFDVQAAYCLATTLRLPTLQKAAQAYILIHLEPQTAFRQYLSPFSQRFHSIRRGMLAYIQEYWHEIRRMPETQDALSRLARGEFPEGALAMYKLLNHLEVGQTPLTPTTSSK